MLVVFNLFSIVLCLVVARNLVSATTFTSATITLQGTFKLSYHSLISKSNQKQFQTKIKSKTKNIVNQIWLDIQSNHIKINPVLDKNSNIEIRNHFSNLFKPLL